MDICEKNVREASKKAEGMSKTTIKEQEYTEALHGIIMLRKGQLGGKEIWFGTVGNQMVSDGVYDTKRELIANLENLTLDRVCKIVAGAFERAITYKKIER